MDVELIYVKFHPKPSFCSDPYAFAPVFPQLVFEDDQAIYEWLGDISVLERSA